MIKHWGKFISDLSERMVSLRHLTEKKTEWESNHRHEKSWKELKKRLTEESVLRFYDPARFHQLHHRVGSELFFCRSTVTGEKSHMHGVQ